MKRKLYAETGIVSRWLKLGLCNRTRYRRTVSRSVECSPTAVSKRVRILIFRIKTYCKNQPLTADELNFSMGEFPNTCMTTGGKSSSRRFFQPHPNGMHTSHRSSGREVPTFKDQQ